MELSNWVEQRGSRRVSCSRLSRAGFTSSSAAHGWTFAPNIVHVGEWKLR
ncbi:hypothetical protein ACFS4T_12470 [Pseudomonas lini]